MLVEVASSAGTNSSIVLLDDLSDLNAAVMWTIASPTSMMLCSLSVTWVSASSLASTTFMVLRTSACSLA